MAERESAALVIENQRALEAFAARLSSASRMGFDTESASFHRYVDRVYLLQISTDTETALVDPLAVPDLSPIGELLRNPDIEIVFHDADYDLRILDRDYGFRATRLFDTRLAAQLAGEPAVGLGALLEKHFGVRLDKRFQRADWSARPLSDAMVAYAADDTRYLLRLRDVLTDRLRATGRLHWLEEECARLEDLRWNAGRRDAEEGFLRIKGAKALPRRALAILERLHSWREATASTLDRAPFRVLGNEALLGIARTAPRTNVDLQRIHGVGTSTVQRHGEALLAAVEEGMAVPSEQLPSLARSKRPPPDAAYDARLERLKTVRNSAATRIGLEPGLVCPNGTLQAIARVSPTRPDELAGIPELRKWQREALGESVILAAVREPAESTP
ncbi:MAG: ribonuclease D [Gemmatimonadales bacterium]|nr:ribonuclease D [Gemmatimonadales bacterium]